MAGCPPFKIQLREDMNTVLARVKALAKQQGISFSGNTNSGQFSGGTIAGTVSGTYRVSGKTVTVTITEKGWAPCGTIEGRLRSYFG